ncbi:MAG: SDR family oxidoreductase [Actinophytocola sp.]|uniref:SDR family oxidoreductase n=1 Tax=Actinophytocola sp. TaxID=1872138 RepID=UPI003C76086B
MSPRWAFVTGSSQRIGAAIATNLAARGLHLHLHANASADRLHRLASDLSDRYGVATRTHLADFRDPSAVDAMASTIATVGPRPGLLVNNAAVFGQYDYSAPVELAAMIDILTVNTAVPILLTALVDDTDGHVVNICDGHVDLTCSRHLAYDISKAALADATRRLAVRLGPNIRVNGIGPGLVLPPPHADEKHLTDLARNAPLRRPARLEDILSALDFLIDSPSVTGQMIMVDSGEHLTCDGEAAH